MPRDEIFSIIGGVWDPGQTTPVHDHLTWALIGVYDGEEREALFRRTDDGSNPKIAKIEKVSEKINTKGHVTVLGHRGIHRVDNISGKPTINIHVYGRDIGHTERHSYDPVTGEIGRFVSGYCNVLRDTILDESSSLRIQISFKRTLRYFSTARLGAELQTRLGTVRPENASTAMASEPSLSRIR